MPARTMTPRVWPIPSRGRPAQLMAPLDRPSSSGWLPRTASETVKDITTAVETFVDRVAGSGSDGQVRRAAQRLGLIGTAGEMAAGWGIVPWAPGEAYEAAEAALASWVRDVAAPRVRKCAKRFLASGCSSRPMEIRASNPSISPMIFGRSQTEPDGGREQGPTASGSIPAETWKTEICSGIDAGLVARVLSDRGMLARGDDGFLRVHQDRRSLATGLHDHCRDHGRGCLMSADWGTRLVRLAQGTLPSENGVTSVTRRNGNSRYVSEVPVVTPVTPVTPS